jgi:DNA-directed RNA polymerase subunit RPC12/RpoP
MKKLDYEYVRKEIEEHGCELLTKEYSNKRQLLSVIGICGHEYKIHLECFENKKQYICDDCIKMDKLKEVDEIFYNRGLTLLENNYSNFYTKMNCIDSYGYKYRINLADLCGKKCRKSIATMFNISNPYTTYNIALWIKINNKPFDFYAGEFESAKTKNLFFKCHKCGEIWDTFWELIYCGIGCPYCSGKRIAKSKSLGFLYPEIVQEWDYSKNKKTPFDFLPGSGKKAWWKCEQCGNSWETVIYNRTKIHTGCPVCWTSGPAKRIYFLLKSNNINFNTEQKFNNLVSVNNTNLRYDFSILEKNKIIFLIEYDDEQHERFIPHFHKNMEKFLYQKENDDLKTNYAIENSIPLRRIKHSEINYIDNIVLDILESLRREEEF